MDKILSELEKQRRAENIYYSRRNLNSIEREEDIKRVNIYKILFQILLLINMVIFIFSINNKEYVFKEKFLSDLNVICENIKQRANSKMYISDMENEIVVENNLINVIENKSAQTIENTTISEEIVEKVAEKSIEEQEIETLIGMYQFKKPIDNVNIITSNFGERTLENENVSEYHTGIDIGSEIGTDIKSSINGIVTLVSNVGDYGKQVRVRSNNVTTLYAHCSEILVKEGDIVAEGQVIAKVGNTGRSTGPHLHFEIRVDDRCLDPAKLVKFN